RRRGGCCRTAAWWPPSRTTAPRRRWRWLPAPMETGSFARSSPPTWAFRSSRWWSRRWSRSSLRGWVRKRRLRRRWKWGRWPVHKVLAVVRREFLTRVRTRAFLIGTFMGPLLMGFLFVLPLILSRRETAPKRIVVLDAGRGALGQLALQRLQEQMRDTVTMTRPLYRASRVAASAEELPRVRDSLVALTEAGAGALDGVLIVDDSTLLTGRIRYLGVNVGSPSDMGALRRALDPMIKSVRL